MYIQEMPSQKIINQELAAQIVFLIEMFFNF